MKPHGMGGVNGLPDLIEMIAARDFGEALAPEGVEADIEALDTGRSQGFQIGLQQNPVGGQGNVAEPLQLAEFLKEGKEVPADQGLSSRDADFGYAKRDADAQDAQNFLVAQDVLVGHAGNGFPRDTIGAPQIAAICDRNPQIVESAAKLVV